MRRLFKVEIFLVFFSYLWIEVQGVPTPDLASFIKVMRELTKDGTRKHIYVLSQNLRDCFSFTKPDLVILDYRLDPLRIFEFDKENLDWVEVEKEDKR